MTQNKDANSAPVVEQSRLRPPARWAAFFAGAMLLNAQVANVKVGVTATQAVVTYSAPDNGPCLVEIREGDMRGPLAHDVNPALFSGSNLDSGSSSTRTSVNIATGRRRIFVGGKRAAEPALDGMRYSRALQTDALYSYEITCGASTATGQFTTMNAPLGMSYNDPLPVDPNHPGQYAWPDFKFTDRTMAVIDPFTGFRIKLLDSPRDSTEVETSKAVASAFNAGTGTDWHNPSNVIADDSAMATYSGTTQGLLFVDLGLVFQNSSAHTPSTPSINTIVPIFKAYCSSSDCASASADDRSLQFCLTTNGTTCASDWLEMPLTACSGNSCGTTGVPALANPQTLLADWFASNHGMSTVETTDLSKRTGSVSRTGAMVTQIGGDQFNIKWTAGATITINGTRYTIASVDHDKALTLAGSPSGSDSSAQYSASNGGILVRKKTASTHEVSIQSINYDFELGDAAILESGGDQDTTANCSPVEVAGPNSEMGWHCMISAGVYWIGKDTGTVSRLGRSVPPYDGTPIVGWNQHACSGGSYWDFQDPNSLYCPIYSVSDHLYIFKFTYSGSNADVGDLGATQAVTVCNGSNAPCWLITNLTPDITPATPNGPKPLDLQMPDAHPDWITSNFHTNTIALFGRMGPTNSLMFMARRDGNNDTMAFLFRFNLSTAKIESALPTWRKWPLRWAAMHGPFNINDPNWIQVADTFFRGPFTGNDHVAGNGPYYSTITNPGGIDGVNHTCPTRPADSPIAISDWPAGDRCITLTVDGEPGDPTPFKYSAGTISVTGTTVTGTNVYWTSFMDGSQMVIDGNFYIFHYIAHGDPDQHNQGTLDRAPGAVANPNYVMYLELINNPKTGNPTFSYLQDAEVRDIFCATERRACAYNYPANEFMRLILKTGNTWTMQRGFAGSLPPREMKALSESSWLIATPSSCYFGTIYPCPDSRVAWNATHDQYGYNAAGTTVVSDPKEKGCCHATRQNGINVAMGLVCPHDGEPNSGCYTARFSGPPEAFSDEGFSVSYNPFFHGIGGIGTPNSVDSHASHTQSPPAATSNDMRWMTDARPFLGNTNAQTPGTLVAGSLYKFASAPLHRRVLPTHAACGANPLLDISGPASAIGAGPSDNYKYCVAGTGGECASGSAAGDLYVNCPQVRLTFCPFPGTGSSDPETRDICVMDLGSQAHNLTQVGIDRPDPDGLNSRRVTAAFTHTKWIAQFWNTKTLPNGRWMLGWSVFHQNLRTSVLLVKLPVFPSIDGINRGDFLPYKVSIPASQLPGVTNAVVEFWYEKTVRDGAVKHFCANRSERCVQGAAADFAYQSENPAGMACTNGCTISVQALPQRVLYYEVVLRDVNNNVVGRQDTMAVPMK